MGRLNRRQKGQRYGARFRDGYRRHKSLRNFEIGDVVYVDSWPGQVVVSENTVRVQFLKRDGELARYVSRVHAFHYQDGTRNEKAREAMKEARRILKDAGLEWGSYAGRYSNRPTGIQQHNLYVAPRIPCMSARRPQDYYFDLPESDEEEQENPDVVDANAVYQVVVDPDAVNLDDADQVEVDPTEAGPNWGHQFGGYPPENLDEGDSDEGDTNTNGDDSYETNSMNMGSDAPDPDDEDERAIPLIDLCNSP